LLCRLIQVSFGTCSWRGGEILKKKNCARIKVKIIIGLTFFLIFILFNASIVKAAANESGKSGDIDYTQIQEVIDDILRDGNAYDFEKYTQRLLSGEETFSVADIARQLVRSMKSEFKANISTFIRLISIALIAAVFTNLAMAFKNSQVSETGYYITYLILFGLLISSFITASKIAVDALSSILDFMRVLVPVYFMSVGFCSGSTTALVYYEAALTMITLVEFLIIKIVIPMINVYLVITLVNHISKEDMLSKLAGLFAALISWLLKSLIAAVAGFNAIQGLIVPVADRVKRSAILKVSEAIPGIGNIMGNITETVLGAGMLLKNAIGVAGMVAILLICAVPFMKLFMILVIYKISGAVLQPVSDKRIVECISASARSAGFLLHAVFVGAVLFLLSITIVAVTTGNAG
jgi:stage III sporulation protein AE